MLKLFSMSKNTRDKNPKIYTKQDTRQRTHTATSRGNSGLKYKRLMKGVDTGGNTGEHNNTHSNKEVTQNTTHREQKTAKIKEEGGQRNSVDTTHQEKVGKQR